jgi:hypothetical protein
MKISSDFVRYDCDVEIVSACDKSILPMEIQQQRPPYALVEGLSLENRPIRGNNDESIAVRKSERPAKAHQVKLSGPPHTPTTKR